MLRALLTLIVLARGATAEPWYAGKYGRNRVVHLAVTGSFGVAYLATESVFTRTSCQWCDPPGFDRAVRDALVWDDTARASLYSNMAAYIAAPIMGLGLLIASEHDAHWSRLIDDTLPVLETVAISQVLTSVVKLAVARQRPYARFDTTDAPFTRQDNLAFWSGHSALGFGITTSAGLIAHWRGYWTEPYIWGVGITLSLTTEYLRIAADRHYLTDVIAGGFVGIGSGLLIPRLMRRELRIVPVARGAAVAGTF